MMSVGDGEMGDVNTTTTAAAAAVVRPGTVPAGVRAIDGYEIQDTLGKGMSGK